MKGGTLRMGLKQTQVFGPRQPEDAPSGVRPRPVQSASLLAGRGGARGLMLGPYELLDELGKGAFGYVYRARHTLLARSVAIKVLSNELAGDAGSVARFLAEARVVNMLHHPNVLDVTDIVLASGPGEVPFIVMELLEGADLASLVDRREVDLRRALRIMRDVCEGLDAIHRIGVVHRDVKPENIFIVPGDGRDHVKLIDFGIARLPDVYSAEPVAVEEIVGTPRYMAPEQAKQGRVDHRADLYAVGAVLMELLTGRPPFEADDLRQLLAQSHLEAPLPSSRVTLPKAIRHAVDRLIARCLRKDPADRPAAARAIILDIDDVLQRLSAAEKIDALAKLPDDLVSRPSGRPRRFVHLLAGAAVVAVGAALAAMWIGSAQKSDAEPDPGATRESSASAAPATPSSAQPPREVPTPARADTPEEPRSQPPARADTRARRAERASDSASRAARELARPPVLRISEKSEHRAVAADSHEPFAPETP